jgi:hypothetical protein
VGIEVCRGSMKSFQFLTVDGRTHISYEFSKDPSDPCDLNRLRDDISEISD